MLTHSGDYTGFHDLESYESLEENGVIKVEF